MSRYDKIRFQSGLLEEKSTWVFFVPVKTTEASVLIVSSSTRRTVRQAKIGPISICASAPRSDEIQKLLLTADPYRNWQPICDGRT
jgi:hypothetical protein